jgi:hypothetical protein
MLALTPTTEVRGELLDRRFVPTTDSRSAANKFYHSITSSAWASIKTGIVRPRALAGLEIYHQIYFGALLDWEVGRLGTLENFPNVDPCLLK